MKTGFETEAEMTPQWLHDKWLHANFNTFSKYFFYSQATANFPLICVLSWMPLAA